MPLNHRFTASLRWTGAAAGPTRDYAAYSRDWAVEIPGRPPLRGSSDRAFRGDPALHNPEDLLIVALATCHMLSYLAEASRTCIQVVDYSDDAEATMVLGKGGGGRFVDALLRPRVLVAAGTDRAAAEALHEVAHSRCFIANSVNFPVRHEPETTLADAP